MKIAFQNFYTERSKGGALYFYAEASRLLASVDGRNRRAQPHDFFELARSTPQELAGFVRSLDKTDVVVSNVGPYAHLYHYLREAYGGEFRIIRDVQTSSWAGFLLQEALAGPLVRPGDMVLFPSEFCRAYFRRLFPHSLNQHNTAVCYPLDQALPAPAARRAPGPVLNFGYIGRMSGDKNFAQVLDLFSTLYRARHGNVRLHLAGPFEPFSRYAGVRRIVSALSRHGVAPEHVTYHGHLSLAKIWDFYAQIDLFFFPAMSSVESLGRVMLEAQHAGVPTIAVDYAAAAEILPATNLASPRFANRQFDLNETFSFGAAEADELMAALDSAQVGPARIRADCYCASTYLHHVLGERDGTGPAALSRHAANFISAIRLSGADLQLSREAAMRQCRELLGTYASYNDNALRPRLASLVRALALRPGDTNSVSLHLNRLFRHNERFELAHAREHCRAGRFTPTLSLDAGILQQHGTGADTVITPLAPVL